MLNQKKKDTKLEMNICETGFPVQFPVQGKC